MAWVCDVLLSEHSVGAYGRDLAHFAQHMRELGVDPLSVTADHVKLYKAALLKAGITPATIARRLSVLRGTYRQFAEKGLIEWETTQDISAVKAPPVAKNTTPALTTKQAIALLGGDSHGHAQGAAGFRTDFDVLYHRLPGLGADSGVRGPSGV